MKLRRWIFFGLWAGSLVLLSFFGGTISYGLFFFLTLIPVCAWIYIFAVVMGVRIYQSIGGRTVVCGEMTDYYFELQNDMPFAFSSVRVKLYPDFFDVEELPQDMEYELLPKEKHVFRTRLSCRYRGEYEVGVQAFVVTDCFRLFSYTYELPGNVKAIVKPRFVLLDGLKSLEELSLLPDGKNTPGGSYLDAVVRDYEKGDSMGFIHWKATARTQSLKVRTRYDESQKAAAVYFSGKRKCREQKEYLPLENKVLEVVLALGGYFAYQKIPVWVSYESYGEHCEERIEDAGGFEVFYQSMSEVGFSEQVEEEKELLQFFGDCLRRRPQLVFLVLSSLPEDFLEYAEEMGNLGVQMVVYLVSEKIPEKLLESGSLQCRFFHVGTEEDVSQCL